MRGGCGAAERRRQRASFLTGGVKNREEIWRLLAGKAYISCGRRASLNIKA